MKGYIETREKCFVCGGKLVHDEKRNGCFCQTHPQVSATSFIVRFGRDVFKRFKSYPHASQFLSGLRFKTGEGTFDKRDYQRDKPLSFTNLSEKYLSRRKNLKSFKEVRRYIRVAQDYFKHTNIKDINGADIDDFLFSIENISEKTRSNYASGLSTFYKWLFERSVINLAQIPHIPKIQYDLGTRTITNWETQSAIINEVKKISYHINPKIWFGIDLLASYVNLRPGDLLKVMEKDIDPGVMTINNPTKSKNKKKTVRLLDRHIELFAELQSQYAALPHMPFFRHVKGISGCKANKPFGPKYFKKVVG